MPLTIVHVGLGGWGQNWVTNVLPRVANMIEHVAWVDADATTLAAAQQKLNLPKDRCFTSLDAALVAIDAEAVMITTQLVGHIPVVEAALNAGKHVVVEKPFAPSLTEAQCVVDLAAKRGLTLMISQNYRHQPAPRAVAELIAKGELGAVGEITIDFGATPPDRATLAITHSQTSLLIDMAIHHFDLLRMVLGQEPTSISCHAWNPPWSEFVGDAAAVATITFASGAVASWRGSWVSPGEPTPWAGEWRIECANAEIQWRSRDDNGGPTADHVLVRPRDGAEYEVKLPPVEPYGRAGVLAAFAKSIQTRTEPETSGRDNLGTLALAEAAVASAARGQPVEL